MAEHNSNLDPRLLQKFKWPVKRVTLADLIIPTPIPANACLSSDFRWTLQLLLASIFQDSLPLLFLKLDQR